MKNMDPKTKLLQHFLALCTQMFIFSSTASKRAATERKPTLSGGESTESSIMNGLVTSTSFLSLPEDVSVEILLCLSAWSLSKLKQVCRELNRLINNAQFVQSHLRRSMSRVGILFISRENINPYRLYYLSFDDSNSDGSANTRLVKLPVYHVIRKHHNLKNFCLDFRVIDSCDGLILVLTKEPRAERLFIWNPVTGSSRLLFVSDKLGVCHRAHLTYDPTSQRYHVVWSSFEYATNGLHACHVVTLDCGDNQFVSWKQLLVPRGLNEGVLESSISGKGKVHWLMMMNEEARKLRVLTLDLATEEFNAVDCSPTPFHLRMWDNFYALNGAFYHNNYITKGNEFELWVLKDFDKPAWLRIHATIDAPLPINTSIKLIHILEDRSNLVFVSSSRHTLFVYNTCSRKWMSFSLTSKAQTLCGSSWSCVGHFSSLVHWNREI